MTRTDRTDATDTPPAGAERGEEELQQALAYVLRSTAQRPQSEAEVRDRLGRRQVPPAVVDAALHRARSLGAVDDTAFARAWVEDRGRRRGYGVARLRQELRRRQVREEAIDDALALLDDRDELAAATELGRERAARLPASLPPETAARRLAAFLQRRGYPPGLAERAAREVSGLDRVWD